MTKTFIITSSYFLFLISFLSGCAPENQNTAPLKDIPLSTKTTTSTPYLITVDEVKKWLDNKEAFIIFEISKKEKYQQGHLPNAIHLWRPDYENHTDFPYTGMMASQTQMETLLSKKGVSPNAKIILYDTKGSSDAMRFCWILRVYGYENVWVMNGGKIAWKQAGYPLSTAPPKTLPPTTFTFSNQNKTLPFATFEDVQMAILDSNYILLDTREPEEYHGQPYINKNKLHPYKKGAFTNGCIPTAKHLNWSDAVDLKGDHCFKSLKDLRYNFEQAGILADKKIITYCQSGVRSAHTAYVLTELLDYPNVMNYDGSWIEWSYHFTHKKEVDIEQHTPKAEFEQQLEELKEKKISF